MPLNETDTRAKLIDPAIHKCGWTEDLIRREETAGTVEIINGKARRRSRGKIDYVLRVKVRALNYSLNSANRHSCESRNPVLSRSSGFPPARE
jgi:hypothetical protein